MSIQRKANAHWQGNGKNGKGTLTAPSGIFSQTPYSFATRFESAKGTNPEELIAAALSGCFSMKLAFILQEANITPDDIKTEANVILDDGKITTIELTTRVSAAGLSNEDFQRMAKEAKETCPVSQLMNAKITLDAELD
jgi:lipoyl-dependent peroxiredoxin